MGNKDSRPSIIPYEDAIRRVTEEEFKRIREAFKRYSTPAGYMSRPVFVKDVLGDGMPPKLGEHLYCAFGGTNKGLVFKDLFTGLVLLARGSQTEKLKFIFALCASHDGGMYISQEDLEQFISTCDGSPPPQEVAQLFREDDRASYEQFCSWLLKHSHVMKLSAWLLQDSNKPGLRLSDESDTPTFYQTLAGVTHLEEAEIIELEKKYWALQAQSKTGRFDLDTFIPLISPPMPRELCEGIFNAFDVNSDNHIDLKEMACGLSACCRGPRVERQKFFFKIFDTDQDNLLNKDELEKMVKSLINVRRESRIGQEVDYRSVENLNPANIAADILANHDGDNDGCITQEEFLMWALKNSLPDDFCKQLFQVCHIILGLKPQSTEEEKEVILGWVEREKRRGLRLAQTWYLISMNWWRMWNHYVAHKPPISNHSNTSSSSSQNSVSSLSRPANQAWSESRSRSPLLSRRGNHHHSNGTGLTPHSPTRSPKRSNSGNQGSLGPPKPGLIDNTCLIMPDNRKVGTLTNEGGRLKRTPPLVQGKDYEVIPEPVWKALSQWYAGGPALPRNVIVPLEGEPSATLELYPISVRLLRHQTVQQRQNAWNGVNIGNVSIGAGGISFGQNNSSSTPPAPKRYLAYTSCFSKMHTMQQIYEFLSVRLRIRSEEMRLWNLKDENNPILLEDDSSTMEQQGISEDQPMLIEVRNKDLSWPEEMSLLAKSKQDKQKQVVRTECGLTGMSNLGNTCFMNAAIQCISNTQPLTLYFKSDSFLYELNSTNPLGMKGHVAKRYGDLIRELWAGNAKSVAPLKLRWTIAKYAPRFNGFQQQDSQELLAFLLDGLHEDLNRVQEKPYVELKDSDGRPDEEVSQEAWENHLRRNQSVIVDLFQGQLKSQVRCKTCGHTSVRFDPFIFLSLPLPMESSMHVEIVVVRLDGSVPIKYGLRLNMEAKYKAFKKQLGELCDLQPDQLLLVEIGGAMVRSFPSDAQKIRTLLGGLLYCYEIPLVTATVANKQYMSTQATIQSESLINLQPLPPINSPAPCGIGTTQPAPPNGVVRCNHQATSISMTRVGGAETGAAARLNGEAEQSEPSRPNGDVVLERLGDSSTPVKQHSRTPSTASAASSVGAPQPVVYSFEGFVIAMHRKMIRMDMYFLSWQKSRPCLFGIPLILPCVASSTTHEELYASVWKQVNRLVSSTAPMENGHKNHAEDGPRHSYPFTLKAVQKDGITCAWCPWYRFCRGCEISCTSDPFTSGTTFLAIDWDPTALHLRYQSSQERVVTEHESVEKSRRLQTEPISLDDCLRAFTKEEELGEDELYYCSKCKHHRLAVKKLDIWRLPPILVIHLKRFQFVNGRWVKSQKIVKFPKENFDPSNFLAPRNPLDFRNLIIGRQRPRSEMMELIQGKEEGGKLEEETTGKGEGDSLGPQGGVSVNAIKVNDRCAGKDRTDSNLECTCGGHTQPVQPAPPDNKDCDSGTANHSENSSDGNSGGGSAPSSGDEEMGGRGKLARQRSVLTQPTDATDAHPLLKEEIEDDKDEHGLSPSLYNLYSMACHSGILGGGHYVAYAVNPNKKWYCYNDSSVKEVKDEIDKDNAYMLFYERHGLSYADFIPDVRGKEPDTTPIDDDIEADYRRFCVIQ
ncbi:ubiquitin carboxyl-terminal hydrolase 32-like isoform X2 [Acanthaster planci]|uniref:ubiquitinyl hydrolase 1 n=1 Tax=Acanthaster planci TaxID=133434 RepID=A0A8B7ZDI9_ACAPL|nr:ubiquitin carboxyl-terminal hydrolase 32-like isoform X2 [Acanthaster planci]